MPIKLSTSAERRKKQYPKTDDRSFEFYERGSDSYYQLMQKQNPARYKKEKAANIKKMKTAFGRKAYRKLPYKPMD